MSTHCFVIRTLTNLHVGSGDSHYGVIDNLVQRDALTNYPGIHASSLKGALREAFSQQPGVQQNQLRDIFGDGPAGQLPGQAGGYHLSSAHLLSFPVRSNKVPFVRVTSPGLIQDLLDSQQTFGFTLAAQAALKELQKLTNNIQGPSDLSGGLQGAILERHTHTVTATLGIDTGHISALTTLFGEHLVVVPDALLSVFCGENRLPVVARNNLDNGISRNLWYEEIVPRETRFWGWLLKKKADAGLTTAWDTLLKKPVQIGANASIGYGYCELKTV